MDKNKDLELRDENIYPDKEVLKSALGPSYEAFSGLLDLYDANEMNHEWRYYKDGKAWLCKVQKKKKTIVWMSAWKGFLEATLYFPVRLLDKVLELDLADELKQKIVDTRNVGKSKPCTFEIRDTRWLGDFEKVMLLKIKSK